MTVPGGYVAGDVLTAANMNLLPGGLMARASVTANQAGITTEADLTSLTVTWTAVSARLYRISFYVTLSVTSTTNRVEPSVYITDGSNTKKQTATVFANAGSVGSGVEPSFNVTGFVLETGLSGSTTRKLRATASEATDLIASSTQPAYILVEDIGPA